MAIFMHRSAPSPEGDTISAPSEVAPYPVTSQMMFAPRAKACSSSSTTTHPPPREGAKPSLFASYAREAIAGVSLYLLVSAPIASNIAAIDQCISSAPPARRTSCLPSWISSTACPMQCALVAQADESE